MRINAIQGKLKGTNPLNILIAHPIMFGFSYRYSVLSNVLFLKRFILIFRIIFMKDLGKIVIFNNARLTRDIIITVY